MISTQTVDVLCVGHASYDIVVSVPYYPHSNEKVFADTLLMCGGGPAANAAVTVARLGYRSAFAGYLGNDTYGTLHFTELAKEGIVMDYLMRGIYPTPLSVVVVQPNGDRMLVNYKGATQPLEESTISFSSIRPAVFLLDGHEPYLSKPLSTLGIPTVLDAGSVHYGTQCLLDSVDFLVASEKFAQQWLGEDNPERALHSLAEHAPAVVITLGERGLLWKKEGQCGHISAFPVAAVDTTGAGDVFHGAFAAGLSAAMPWLELLRFATAAAGISCTHLGARPSIPYREEVERFLKRVS